jgi:hypothetical protein
MGHHQSDSAAPEAPFLTNNHLTTLSTTTITNFDKHKFTQVTTNYPQQTLDNQTLHKKKPKNFKKALNLKSLKNKLIKPQLH